MKKYADINMSVTVEFEDDGENIGITDGSYIAQLDAALAKIKGGPDAR